MCRLEIFPVLTFLCTVWLNVQGNLITLDGRCPVESLKPAHMAIVPVLKGKFNSIAETADENGLNRTDITVLLQIANPNSVKITIKFRSTESDKCEEILLFINGTDEGGVFDADYQVAPDTGFVEYKAYFLSLELLKLRAVAFICHDLPYGKYQAEVAVLSALTTNFDEEFQDNVKNILNNNGIGDLYQHIQKITNNNQCNFAATNVIGSLLPVS